MAGLSLDQIRRLARDCPEDIVLSTHATREKLRKNINHDDILMTLRKGTLAKKEEDEKTRDQSEGAFQKFTLDWKNFRLTVKNLRKPRILSIRVTN